MKKYFYFVLVIFLASCKNVEETYYPGFKFSNFEGTYLENLSESIKNNDLELVKKEIASNKEHLNTTDNKYNISLLSCCIINNRKEAFKLLLENGANPDLIQDIKKDNTSITIALHYNEEIDVYFINELIKYQNKHKKYKIIEHSFNAIRSRTYPIIIAINDLDCSISDNFALFKKIFYSYPLDSNDDLQLSEIITECLEQGNLYVLKFLLVEKQIKFNQKVNYKYNEYDSILDVLKLEDYDLSHNTELDKVKKDLITFLNSK